MEEEGGQVEEAEAVASTVVESEKISLTASEIARLEEETILEAQREVQRREKWKSYLAYVDDLVAKTLIKAACSR